MNDESKIGMSLDQIIKMGGNKRRSSGRAGPSRSRRGRGARGGGGSGGRGRSPIKGRYAGTRSQVNLTARRPFRANAGQRLAQNLVKRAMFSSRRQAVAGRRRQVGGGGLAMDAERQRLTREVHKWRTTARILQNAIQNTQRRSPRFNVNPTRRGSRRARFNVNLDNRGSRPLRDRLGWATGSPRGRGRAIRRAGPSIIARARGRGRQTTSVSGRPTLGAMQSDLISREEAHQKKLAADLMALAQSQMIISPTRGRRGFSGSYRARSSYSSPPMRGRRNVVLNNFGQPSYSGNSNVRRQFRGMTLSGPKQFGRRGRGKGRFNNRYSY